MDSQIATEIEMLRPGDAGTASEPAVVVDRQSDPVIGLVLELQFGDAWRVQRIWPSPAASIPAATFSKP